MGGQYESDRAHDSCQVSEGPIRLCASVRISRVTRSNLLRSKKASHPDMYLQRKSRNVRQF
jgi:hypothetical protein